MRPVKLCQRCFKPATKKLRKTSYYYCDQCCWEQGLRDLVPADSQD